MTTVKASDRAMLITAASETAGGVVGTAVLSDSATLAGGYTATGTITFTLTQPDGTTSTEGSVYGQRRRHVRLGDGDWRRRWGRTRGSAATAAMA